VKHEPKLATCERALDHFERIDPDLSPLARKFGDVFGRRTRSLLRDTDRSARQDLAYARVATAGRDASAQADLVGGVFGLRRGEFAAVFGRELFGQSQT
jgi:hypothetical protein